MIKIVSKLEYTEKYILKFLDGTFKDVTNLPWYTTLYYYMIDSKYRTTKRIDLFLKEQLDNPALELVAVAEELRKGCKHPDELMIRILNYVYIRVMYVPDVDNFGAVEKWADAYVTWSRRKDDCDGINALIYILARLAGVSDMVLWCGVGDCSAGGHFWLMYFSTNTDNWHSIDGTYYVDLTPIKTRNKFVLGNNRYLGFWFMFNEEYALKQKLEG